MFCAYFKPLFTFQSLVPFMSMPRHEFPLSFFSPDAGAFMSVLRHDFPSFFSDAGAFYEHAQT